MQVIIVIISILLPVFRLVNKGKGLIIITDDRSRTLQRSLRAEITSSDCTFQRLRLLSATLDLQTD